VADCKSFVNITLKSFSPVNSSGFYFEYLYPLAVTNVHYLTFLTGNHNANMRFVGY